MTVGGSDDVEEPSAINDRVMNIAVTPPSSQISSFQDETQISSSLHGLDDEKLIMSKEVTKMVKLRKTQ